MAFESWQEFTLVMAPFDKSMCHIAILENKQVSR